MHMAHILQWWLGLNKNLEAHLLSLQKTLTHNLELSSDVFHDICVGGDTGHGFIYAPHQQEVQRVLLMRMPQGKFTVRQLTELGRYFISPSHTSATQGQCKITSRQGWPNIHLPLVAASTLVCQPRTNGNRHLSPSTNSRLSHSALSHSTSFRLASTEADSLED